MSVSERVDSSRCRGRNRAGLPCRRRAKPNGYCSVHDLEAPQDMKELGRRGGRTPKMTALRRAAAEQDDTLREAARAVFARALAGEQVDKEQLAAARSLFSYRADSPPVGAQAREQTGGKVIGLADVVRVAVECGLVRAADGGPVLVDGERVERNDPVPPS